MEGGTNDFRVIRACSSIRRTAVFAGIVNIFDAKQCHDEISKYTVRRNTLGRMRLLTLLTNYFLYYNVKPTAAVNFNSKRFFL